MTSGITPLADRVATAFGMLLFGGVTSGLIWLVLVMLFKLAFPFAFVVAITLVFVAWGFISPVGSINGLGAVWRRLAELFSNGFWA